MLARPCGLCREKRIGNPDGTPRRDRRLPLWRESPQRARGIPSISYEWRRCSWTALHGPPCVFRSPGDPAEMRTWAQHVQVGPGILRFLQLPAGAWVVQLPGYQATEARELSLGEPVLKPKRRHSERGQGVGGRGQGSAPEPGLAVRRGRGRGLQQAGRALLLLMKFGHEGQRGVMQPRNSQRSWSERAMWPRVQAALDGGA